MTNIIIPFNRPAIVGRELEYMADALRSGQTSGDGRFTKQVHALLEGALGVPKVLLTTSCTHALEMSALLLDIQPGDEVIVPSFTFVSTINAFVLRGAKPIFADIRPDTLNIDERLLPGLITPRTKAIIVVHYAGVACDMDTIMSLAAQHNLPVIEDNAHGLFGKYRGRYLGTFGALATQSFHETKNFTCGEGGALLINDAALIERAEIIREKGTNRSRFFRGMVDKYTWVDVGSSYLPSDVLAAYLLAQLEQRDAVQERRGRIWKMYDECLASWASAHGITTPSVPAECEQPYHLYYLLMPSLEARTAFIAHMKANGILTVFHYLPLHLSDMGKTYGGQIGDCPVTEDIADRLVRLPLYNDMSESQQAQVIERALQFAP
ncbi:MAG: dTDP-4-amino-4,6-dideoxygalactose transaminase [Phototrophicales bacterium]|nr:MAG: dTDP-4-amino-4,6-dideoxygalactose transaminase [Phototrophicales bacterium]